MKVFTSFLFALFFAFLITLCRISTASGCTYCKNSTQNNMKITFCIKPISQSKDAPFREENTRCFCETLMPPNHPIFHIEHGS